MGDFGKSLQEISANDIHEVGPKAASLGELARAGFNVPAGHCLLRYSYSSLEDHNQLQPKINSILSEMNYQDFASVESKTSDIRNLITSARFPPELEREVSGVIGTLSGRERHFLAVRVSRVSGHVSEIHHTSLASGMAGPFYYLRGKKPVSQHTKICWSSHWSSRATWSRYHRKVDHNLEYLSPIIQRMVHSRVSGVLYTCGLNPGSKSEIRIVANWGLGDTVVSGRSMNDLFILTRSGLALKEKRIVKKTVMTVFDEEGGTGCTEVAVDSEMMDADALNGRELRELGEVGLEIERLFGLPQEVEWAFEDKKLFILGSQEIQ
ncbi:MAG: PEP/pyruvate-binding domain-containing protein [Thermodesulfobacteriota bacterium]